MGSTIYLKRRYRAHLGSFTELPQIIQISTNAKYAYKNHSLFPSIQLNLPLKATFASKTKLPRTVELSTAVSYYAFYILFQPG